ncbi:hypothetical protein RF11_10023 [Thelohanellus kitauei]|uniref:Uncharacterized protein n=1 Tax=Thelohanellus kitauei TaxID=669202 RepID=A0A0C2NDA8_THEKT|nr:hypothetical protein RF11_10023 [Thelohanellus kitauei]
MIGKNILDEPLTKSIVFTDTNTTLEGEFEIDLKSIPVDVSVSSVYWELRIFDILTGKFKTVIRYSSIEPPLQGFVQKIDNLDTKDECDAEITIRNETNLQLDDVKIRVLVAHTDKVLKEERIRFDPSEKKKLQFHLSGIVCLLIT